MSGAALCAVCLNYYLLNADSFLIFPCGHGFCTGCIAGLCSNPRPKCPNCRRILRKKDAHPVYIEFIDAQTFHETSLVEGLNKIAADNDVKKSLANCKSEGNLPSTSARPDGPVPQQACTGRTATMSGSMVAPGPSQEVHERLSQIPILNLCSLKQELGLGDKSLSNLNWSEKAQIVNLWQAKILGSAQLPSQLPQMHTGALINRKKRNSTSTGDEMSDARPHVGSSPPDRKRVRRSPMEQPTIPLSPHPLQLFSQQPLAQPRSMPQLPPLQQVTMQPPYPHPIQSCSGGARAPPQRQDPLLLTQQNLRMAAVQPPNRSIQGGLCMQMHPRQLQLPQQPTLFRPGAPPGHSSSPAAPAGLPPGLHATPFTRLAPLTKPTQSPGMNGPPKDATNNPPQPNGQSQWPSQQRVPEAWNAPPGTAPSTPARGNHTSPRSQQPAPSNPGGSPTQTPGLGPQPPTAMSSMLGPPVGIPRMNTRDLGTFPPNFISGIEEFDLFKDPGGDINFERDFGQWFTNDESGPVV